MASGVALCVAIYLQRLTSLRCNDPSPLRVPLEVALSCGLPLISILFRTFWHRLPIFLTLTVAYDTGYILASRRYAIIEDLGCTAWHRYSTVLVALVYTPMFGNALVGLVFACMLTVIRPALPLTLNYLPGLAARNLIWRRRFAHLHFNQSMLSTSHFGRLLLLCAVVGIWPLACLLVTIVPEAKSYGPVPPWSGWNAMHKYFHRIITVPASRRSPKAFRVFWMQIANTYVTFGILVCTNDVRRDLKMAWGSIKRGIFCRCRGGTAASPPVPGMYAPFLG